MKILITGGAGFIGSSLCIKLKTRYPSYSIVALDNLRRSGSELNLVDLRAAGVKFIHGDIRCQEDVESVGYFDVLIDASAEPSVMAGITGDPSYVINNNLTGSLNCFNACLRHKARLVFLSTSRVYPIDRLENANFVEEESRFIFAEEQVEKGISEKGVSEDLALLGTRSFYGTTKLAAELFLQEYATFYGLQTAITRLGVVAGPRQMGKTDQGVVTLWMAKHFWKQKLKYIGYGGLGKQVRDILHINDLVNLIDLQIHQPEKFTNKVFNAGGGLKNSASLAEMTAICEKITGNRIEIESEMNNRPADLRCFITDNTRIESEIGWAPEHSIEDIFSDIFHWINENENKLKPILS